MTVRHSSASCCQGPGFTVTVLPSARYEARYVPADHVIGFTFERQRGVDAFGGARRRLFDAEPWRIAFTPAGCEVFSASDKGGEYLVLRVAPGTFARLAPEITTAQLQQFTNVADPRFTPLAISLRRIILLGDAAPPLRMDTLVAAAVERVSCLLDASRQRARPERRMTPRRLNKILDHFETRLDEGIRLADLAADIGLSEAYLARAFRAATGTTLHAALVERRIARARALIEAGSRRSGSVSLAEVASATGFSSHAHMTTAFRRVLGITPSEWVRMFVGRSSHGPTSGA